MRSSFLLKSKHIGLAWLLLPLWVLALGILLGSQSASWLFTHDLGQTVLWEIRLPRVLLAFVVGAMLALAGVLIQGMVRNPLADPGLIGVSGGATVGVALLFLLMGAGLTLSAWMLPVAAVLGALLALILVLRIGAASANESMTYLILAGIAVSTLSGALLGLFSYLASDSALRQLSFWSLGSLSAASWPWLYSCVAILLVLTLFWWRKTSALDALLLGDVEARSLGVNVRSLKRQVVLCTAALVGLAVAVCGIIGFIGLVCPHLARLLTGATHKRVVPLAMLLGGILLVLADALARSMIAPAEIPVGILTALVGGPVFISLLVRERGRLL
ncbi:MAG: hypothetical protein RL217_2016 [Pseudomonadota bacterium]|jgi:iron complex transport system permease protein